MLAICIKTQGFIFIVRRGFSALRVTVRIMSLVSGQNPRYDSKPAGGINKGKITSAQDFKVFGFICLV